MYCALYHIPIISNVIDKGRGKIGNIVMTNSIKLCVVNSERCLLYVIQHKNKKLAIVSDVS